METSGLGAYCVENKLALVPYYGLASGFLTGKYVRGEQVHGQRAGKVKTYANDEGFAVVDEVVAIADELGVDPATVALAWLRQQPGVVAPIASVSSADQLPAILAAAELKLSRSHILRLTKVSTPFC